MHDSFSMILRSEAVSCVAEEGESRVFDLSFQIERGSLTQICGETGSGRRVLFDLLGWLRLPTTGDIYFGNTSSKALSESERGTIRNESFGFCFSAPFLIPAFSVLENVAMPLFKVSGAEARVAKERTEHLLEFVGLAEEAETLSLHLPVVSQFRCALARALVNAPQVLLIESPGQTAQEESSAVLWELAHQAIEQFGVTVIWSENRPWPQTGEERVLQLRGGRIVWDSAPVESRADAS